MSMELQPRRQQQQQQQEQELEREQELEQEQEEHPYMSLYEPLLMFKDEELPAEAVKAETDVCLSSSSSSSWSLQRQTQHQHQQPEEIFSSSSAVAVPDQSQSQSQSQSHTLPPRPRTNAPTTSIIDIDRAKKRQKILSEDEDDNDSDAENDVHIQSVTVDHKENAMINSNLNEQIDHILKTFLDDDDADADDADADADDDVDVDVDVDGNDGRINNTDSFNSINNENENESNIERMKLATNNNKKIYSKPHSASTASDTDTATSTTDRSIDGNLNGNYTDSGISATAIRMTELPDAVWMEMYERLLAYKKEHNDTRVPQRYNKDPKLGKWVHNQRKNPSRKKKMVKESKRLLNSIGFVWTFSPRNKATWEEMYQRLVAYKKEHKDTTNVPKKYEEDPQLGTWVDRQRTYYKREKMTEERKRRLDSIGFAWFGKVIDDNAKWEEMYQRLVAYKKEHKDTMVPKRLNNNKDSKLGRWVSTQREWYKSNKMTEKRKLLLNSIDFVWEVWEGMYQRLVAYINEHGHEHNGDSTTNVVPQQHYYKEDPKLGTWVRTQRTAYRKKTMREERKRLFNSIGFLWE